MREAVAARPAYSLLLTRYSSGRHARRRGLSLVELLVSLAITAALLTATMVAVDASFRAYASAAESASTQTSTRLSMHKLLTLIRNSTAHGPLSTIDDPAANFVGDTYTSNYLELIDTKGDLITVSYDAAAQTLFVTTVPAGGGVGSTQPMLGGVTNAEFVLRRRRLPSGIWVLDRASVDVTVQPDTDNTLALEDGDTPLVRLVASTMPRRID